MVKRPKKFVIVDDSSPPLVRKKCPKGRAGSYIRLLDVMSGHFSISPHCPSYPMNVCKIKIIVVFVVVV